MAVLHINNASVYVKDACISLTDSLAGRMWKNVGTYQYALQDLPAVVYDSKMWTIGGMTGAEIRHVYSSANGATWTAYNNALPIGVGRHASVVFDDKMWVIGGSGTGNRRVLHSTNGTAWTTLNDVLPTTFLYHTAVVFNGKMWILGGYTGEVSRKVFSSADGETWTEEGTDVLPYRIREHSSVVYDNKMWIIGGFIGARTKKVCCSSNGADWTDLGEVLPIELVSLPAVVFNNKMYIIGGLIGALGSVRSRKVFCSSNGTDWKEVGYDSMLYGVSNHASVVYDNKMWTICGVSETGRTQRVLCSPA